ncbi:MAG TPA: T9SS type A sorting domain-containing protein, partial [Bacteroidales bacterium]|nr:T9SS type A sorting domain-containing protein [Bacteroidales bacterium]
FTRPAVGGYVWQSSGNIDLSGLNGIVWVGFKYHYSEEYRRWQVDNISITGDPVGISKMPLRAQLNIAPNPTSDMINIDIPENAARVAVYDMTGSLIKEYRVIQPKHLLNLGSHKKGVYVIELIFTDGKLPVRSKVIVQ